MTSAPAWLVARPIAHRGLHAEAEGRIENSLAAARAARERRFAIECDLQRTADGEAMVFHDLALDRLTGRAGAIGDLAAHEARRLTLRDSSETLPTLGDLLGAVEGAVPLVCEVKSRFDGDLRLAERAADVTRDYAGPLAFKSFDPAIVAVLRRLAPDRPVGLVTQARFDKADWAELDPARRAALAALTHFGETRPDFLSFAVDDLPHAAMSLARAFGLPVMAWTVRRPEQRQKAAVFADQMVFEGFLP